eukprot:TRINITY_DN18926_c0_g1_i1.p1 TRINITY_DN18926_c0_g1~~TRINITY_DN18926_c0_g1_i1.p1  ORF type:complete len:572 (+),score=102.89 TRINITY_DN18926_c0_g1_i1:41-1756(+)
MTTPPPAALPKPSSEQTGTVQSALNSVGLPDSLDDVYGWVSRGVGSLGLDDLFGGATSGNGRSAPSPTAGQIAGAPSPTAGQLAGPGPIAAAHGQDTAGQSNALSGVDERSAPAANSVAPSGGLASTLSSSLSGFIQGLGGASAGGDCATMAEYGRRSPPDRSWSSQRDSVRRSTPEWNDGGPSIEAPMREPSARAGSQRSSSPDQFSVQGPAAKPLENERPFENPVERFQEHGDDRPAPSSSPRRSGANSSRKSSSLNIYDADKEDLLDQHVAYYLRHHPDVASHHSISRRRPGIYDLDGREIQVEWQYSSEPGGQGCLVVVDGPLRQPFSDYMEQSEKNAEYDIQGIGVGTSLHSIPKEKRMSFHDQHKMYSRLEAMKVAKEQALMREKAADYTKDGREVPKELMSKYKKNLQQKLNPGGQKRQVAADRQQPPATSRGPGGAADPTPASAQASSSNAVPSGVPNSTAASANTGSYQWQPLITPPATTSARSGGRPSLSAAGAAGYGQPFAEPWPGANGPTRQLQPPTGLFAAPPAAFGTGMSPAPPLGFPQPVTTPAPSTAQNYWGHQL